MEDLDTIEEIQVKEPDMWAVIFHNDDYTSMEFVMRVLEQYFHKNKQEARRLTMEVHNEGRSCVDVSTCDIAETRSTLVMMEARKEEVPLLVTVERA